MHKGLGAVVTAALLAFTPPAFADATLDRIKDSGKLTLGYRSDIPPYSFDNGGNPDGFSVALCQRIAQAVQTELNLPDLTVDYVPLTAADRLDAIRQGRVDLSCGDDEPTFEHRREVEFSIPILLSGTGAILHADAGNRLRDALDDRTRQTRPIWRAAPGDLGINLVVAAVAGTSVEKELVDQLSRRRISITVESVPDYAVGVQMVHDRRAAVLFGDRPVLLYAAEHDPDARDLRVLDARFSFRPVALSMRREDNDLRLLVDRTLAQLFQSSEIGPIYARYFGEPDQLVLEFFQSAAAME
ncbi:MAG: amino acid ABC transporter substrate-binding protein [Paracoccus sp. (in: a-proteobacteria)]|nr:amino acid ABC transporter substrate-binding protein [Paracoccus sp. (in: a-proteobacteria)]